MIKRNVSSVRLNPIAKPEVSGTADIRILATELYDAGYGPTSDCRCARRGAVQAG